MRGESVFAAGNPADASLSSAVDADVDVEALRAVLAWDWPKDTRQGMRLVEKHFRDFVSQQQDMARDAHGACQQETLFARLREQYPHWPFFVPDLLNEPVLLWSLLQPNRVIFPEDRLRDLAIVPELIGDLPEWRMYEKDVEEHVRAFGTLDVPEELALVWLFVAWALGSLYLAHFEDWSESRDGEELIEGEDEDDDESWD